MAIFSTGPILGPAIAPVIGDFGAQSIGWRWIFWIQAIGVGAITIVSILFMKETDAPILLETKFKRLRKETGNTKLIKIHDNGRTPSHLFRTAIVRPLKMLFLQPIVPPTSLYTALIFGYLFLLFTAFTEVFEEQYYFSGRIVGLSYLGLGIGMIFGLVGFSALSDRVLKRVSTSSDGEMKPEYRLPMMFYCSPILPIGFFWYGCGAEAHKHWIVPMLGTGAVGIGILCTFLPTQIYLVDAFPIYAASVLAANTVLHCLFGGVLPLAGEAMYKSLGLGWGNSVLASVAMDFRPVPWLFYRYGEQIRKRFEIEL